MDKGAPSLASYPKTRELMLRCFSMIVGRCQVWGQAWDRRRGRLLGALWILGCASSVGACGLTHSLDDLSRDYGRGVLDAGRMEAGGADLDADVLGRDVAGEAEGPAQDAGSWWRPTGIIRWHYQLESLPAETVDRDVLVVDFTAYLDALRDGRSIVQEWRSKGRKVLGNFSACTAEQFRSDWGQFPSDALGKVVSGYEDERWIDIRNARVREIMKARVDAAKQGQLDGLLLSNFEGISQNSGLGITASDANDYAEFLSRSCHDLGLTFGIDRVPLAQAQVLEPHVDLVLGERCFVTDGCAFAEPWRVAGKSVLGVEMFESQSAAGRERDSVCQKAVGFGVSMILKTEESASFALYCD